MPLLSGETKVCMYYQFLINFYEMQLHLEMTGKKSFNGCPENSMVVPNLWTCRSIEKEKWCYFILSIVIKILSCSSFCFSLKDFLLRVRILSSFTLGSFCIPAWRRDRH